VAVFLGRNAAAVDSFNEPKAQELLAAKLLTQVRRPWPDFDCYLAPREYQHPMLSGFRGCTQGVPWDQYPVFRYWELEKPAAGVSVVVPFNDDGPAVLERPLGTGRAITVTTPVSDRGDRQAWNRLPIPPAWPFGILANYMMYYLVGSTEGQLNYTAGQVALLHFDRHSPQGNYLVTPDDDPTLKFQVALDPQRRVLLVSSTDRPGNYRVQAGGEKAGVDRGFSVNLAPEQTQLERLPRENLKEIFGPYDFRLAQTLDQLDRQINTARVGRDLFPLLILIVALVLGAEHVVANRFYKEG
jgi:hypothetical protein